MTKMLKIDVDFKPPTQWLSEWLKTRATILQDLGLYTYKFTTFWTKRGFHLYITLDKDVPDNIANKYQWLLGDDATRVKINQWRIERGIKRWNKLFHEVLYRRKAKVLTCHYCGNKIPVPDKWFKEEVRR